MDKAKGKVSEFLTRSGKHDTTVHEDVAPAVTHENVKPHQHEKVTTAVDREVHQDHHHTSVQPIHDQEILPEQHHVREHPSESKEYTHGNHDEVAATLQRERANFKDQSVTSPTTATQEHNPSVSGEHVHHHVHENIQPVVEKETVQPHVVHSVHKVHEKHHNQAQIHETSALPAMHMSDFKAKGGSLTGRETRKDEFEGCPRNVHGIDSSNGSQQPQTGTFSNNSNHRDSGIGEHTTQKPSMMDKLNPKVDTDGDGKAGILS